MIIPKQNDDLTTRQAQIPIKKAMNTLIGINKNTTLEHPSTKVPTYINSKPGRAIQRSLINTLIQLK